MSLANNISDTISEEENQEYPKELLEEMSKAGVHLGYSRSSRNPKMSSFVFGVFNNREIFNLNATAAAIEKAQEFLKSVVASGKSVLFVGSKPEARETVKKCADEFSMPFVVERWLGGTLTNFGVVRKNIECYETMLAKKQAGELSYYTKKELSLLSKEFEKNEKRFGGLRIMKEMPGALVIVDPKEEETAVMEAKKMKIPVVAVLNTDCDPEVVEYPVPANDATVSSIEYLFAKLGAAVSDGLKEKGKIESASAKETQKGNGAVSAAATKYAK